MRLPVERSITVSAPQRSAERRASSTSSSSDDVVGELPMLALIFTRAFRPIAIGSSARVMDVGGDDHPAARHLVADRARGSSSSRSATRSISGETSPWRARCICVRQSRRTRTYCAAACVLPSLALPGSGSAGRRRKRPLSPGWDPPGCAYERTVSLARAGRFERHTPSRAAASDRV